MQGGQRRVLRSEIYEEQEPYEDARSVGEVSYRSTTIINGLKVKFRQRSTSTVKSTIKPYIPNQSHYGYQHQIQPQSIQNEYNLSQKQQKSQEPLFRQQQQEQDQPSKQLPGYQFSFGYDQRLQKHKQLDDNYQNQSEYKQQDAHQGTSYTDYKGSQRDPSRELFREKQQDEDDVQTINLGFGKYEGQIYDDTMNGQGIMYGEDGQVVYQGGFKDGEFDGYGILVNTDKHHDGNSPNYRDLSDNQNCWEKYEGMFKDSQKNGVGYLHFSNGDLFVGEFQNDQANGLGIYTSSDHKVFGVWERDHYRKGLS